MRSCNFNKILMCVGLSLLLVACASNPSQNAEVHDPFENINRMMLKGNDTADKIIAEPIAKGYRKYTPRAGRIAVRNFLRNLNSPIVIGNEILQGDVEGAGNATARAVINTLAGFGGILDLASEGGFEHEPEDFGQTLAVWGMGEGPYLMLPLMGPSNARDLSGSIVDSFADPVRIYLFNIEEEHLHYTRVGANALSKREELIDAIDDLRRNSFDYYAAVRSAYTQHRRALINDNQGDNIISMDIPDYGDY